MAWVKARLVKTTPPRAWEESRAAFAERVRAGQNVQFHLREATASQDEALGLLKTATADPGDTVHFGLLMACLGRGKGLFGRADGDISLARQLMPELPVAGAFCNGEIGPIGGTTHLHGYTACWGLLRQDPDSSSGSGSDNLS